MKKILTSLLLVIFLFECWVTPKIVFEDNFQTLNYKKWKHDITLAGGGNWEFQVYDNNRSTTFVKDSKLNIKPVLTEELIGPQNVRSGFTMNLWGGSPADYCTANFDYGCERSSDGNHIINPVMSGKLTTVDSFSFKYGKVEVRAKLPKGNWLWPAIWMLPRYEQYGKWPASGEIDIMESRGNQNYPAGGVDSFASTMHWGPDFLTNQYQRTHAEYKLPSGLLSDDFHTYGLYWDDKKLYTYIDSQDQKILQVDHSEISYWQRSGITNRKNPWQYSPNKCAPFDTEFFLIINLAIGGTNGYFPDGVGGKPWSDRSERASAQFYENKAAWIDTWGQSSAFQIDSVRVWDLSDNEPAQQEKKETDKQVPSPEQSQLKID